MRIFCFVALAFLFAELPACAQPGPIFFVEHDWTLRVGTAKFGLFQDRWLGDENYGGGRHTTLYFGNASVRFKTRNFKKGAESFGIMIVMLCGCYLMIHKSRSSGTSELREGIQRDI